MDYIHGCKICRGAPSSSHLLFVDDSFLFFKAMGIETQVLHEILTLFEAKQLTAINQIFFFNKMVSHKVKEDISRILTVSNPLDTGKYLGLLSLVGKNKRQVFGFLRDKLWKKIQGWQGNLLSQASKETLVKAIR